jgi:hypothetical protein
MPIPAWSAQALPQVPQKGFTESLGVSIIRSPMDSGPAKQRRRSSGVNTMELSFIMTTAETTTLETFINTTLAGTKRFSFPHPRKGTTVEVRIVPSGDSEFFKLQYLAPGYWSTSLKFEILP